MVGILRWALELRPLASTEQLKYSMDVCRFISRLGLAEKFPKDIAVMSDWLDNVLTHVYSKAKSDHLKPGVFIRVHADIIFLVLPKEPTEKILQHIGSFSAVERELAQAASSRVGMALFGQALHSVLGESVQVKIDKAVNKLLQLVAIGRADIADAQKSVLKELEATEFIRNLPHKRKVQMSYHNRAFVMHVRCLQEHVEACFVSALKGRACACKELPSLFCEEGLIDNTFKGQNGQIHPDVLIPWREARDKANAGMGPVRDSASIINFMNKLDFHLVALDRTFRTDMEFIRGMVGDAGAAALCDKVHAILPDKDRRVTLEKAFADLQALQATDLHAFCSLAAQGMVTSVVQYLQGLLYVRKPAFVSNPSAAMAQVKLTLQYFCSAEVDDEILVGKEAVDHYYEQAEKKKEAETLAMEHLEQITKFSWLLDAKQAEQLTMMTVVAMAKLQKDLGTAVHKVGAHKREIVQFSQHEASSSTSKKAKKEGASSSKASEIAAAMSMFRGS